MTEAEDDAIRRDMDARSELGDKRLMARYGKSRAALYRAYWRSKRREREKQDMCETTCIAK